MLSPIQRWLRISLFNLMLVAALGTILRYKIAYALPFIDQKQLMHGHSHFAFAGWISMALMALMLGYLSIESGDAVFKKYRLVLYANLIAAYGMLISFPFEGYGKFSITFSTISIVANYFFAIMFWKDLNVMKQKETAHYWFKAALFFNVLSSLGTFALVYMLVTKNIHQDYYLASVYFYLHFQYNGWFFFACMGLITARLLAPLIPDAVLTKIFWLFAIACIPCYLLSALWLPVPTWIYILVILSAIIQLFAWGWLISRLKRQIPLIKSIFSLASRRIMGLAAIALTIKLLLQLGSTIPALSILAFGFRPIVIGYLHLVLLGVISLFIIGYMVGNKYIPATKTTLWGIGIFISGVIINELLLMIHGISGIAFINVPFINESLLVAAIILFTGMLVINAGVQIGKGK